VIGAKVGDGYVSKKNRVRKCYNDAMIGLKAKDKEFVEEFARCLAKVLGRRGENRTIGIRPQGTLNIAHKRYYLADGIRYQRHSYLRALSS
jgi:hypothetical protein